MAEVTPEEAAKIIGDWNRSFATQKADDEATFGANWWSHMSDQYMEFHTIFPALLEAPMLNTIAPTRFYEPPRPSGPKVDGSDRLIRVMDDVILLVSAGETMRVELDGSIGSHVARLTWVYVKEGDRWVGAHDHYSPPANDPPYGHNMFDHGHLRYTTERD